MSRLASRRLQDDSTARQTCIQMEEGDLYTADLPYYNCGFIVRDGIIVESAPIMKWAVGKTLKEFERWVKSKSGTVIALSSNRQDT